MPATEQEITELRQRLARLEGKVDFLYRHLGLTFVPEAAPGDDPRIIEALKKGKLLDAIRVHREIHGTDYESARAAVEEIQGRLGL